MKRRKLIKNATGIGLMAGLFGNKMSMEITNKPDTGTITGYSGTDASHAEDWHAELTRRIASLEERGGGTLELGDGVYEIDKSLRLPGSVSLVMTPNAVIRAKPDFQGDAVIIKGGGKSSVFSHTSGWIRGGVIDGGRQPLTGLRLSGGRLDIADLTVLNATYKGIHLLQGYEMNITRVRCDIDYDTPYAPGSIGIHYESADSKVNLAHVIGYETGVRSDNGSNWFTMVHVWRKHNSEQGPCLYNFYCNGSNNTFNQCYADSPTIAGFYINKPHQSVVQCRVYFSHEKDNTGVGFMITPQGIHGNYLGNALFSSDREHRLAKAFDGDLSGSTILGTSAWGVLGGLENRIPSGGESSSSPDLGSQKWGSWGPIERPLLLIEGTGFRLTQQTRAPLPEEGELGEVRWVDDGKASALWVKTRNGWKKSNLK